MELNMPIKAVKQKPMANMDFIRTYKERHVKIKHVNLKLDDIWLEFGKSEKFNCHQYCQQYFLILIM